MRFNLARAGQVWLGRLALALGMTAALVFAAEVSLRLVGWGYPTSFCLWQSSRRLYTDNDKFLWQYYSPHSTLRPNPFAASAQRSTNAVRIVVVGDSAAAGTPEPAYSFSRILERMLRHQYPEQRIEVINAAMRGANSHIVLAAARDCLRLRPDVIVVSAGNNEAVGLHAPGPNSGRLARHRQLLRLIQWVRSTRLGEAIEPILQGMNAENIEKQDASFFLTHRIAADDPRRQAVYDNFQANLEDICRLGHQGRTRIVLATVASNLKDSPPFASLHRRGLSEKDKTQWETNYAQGIQFEAASQMAQALDRYSAAAALDDRFAELHFHAARCAFSLGNFEKGRLEYVLARDWDALPLRTDSRQNEWIRRQAASGRTPAFAVVDVEEAFNSSALTEHGIAGERLFYDHVNPTFDGEYLLARTLLPAVLKALGGKLGHPAHPPEEILTRDECAQELAFTPINEAQLRGTVLRLTARPPFTGQLEHEKRQRSAERTMASHFRELGQADLDAAFASFRTAIRQAPDDWQLIYTFARLLLLTRRPQEAIEQFQAARRLLPHWLPIRLGLSSAMSAAGRFEDALWQLNEALAMDPGSPEAKMAIVVIEAQRRKAATR